MNFFGFKITREKIEKVQDQIPEVKITLPDTKRPALIPNIPDPTRKYYSNRGNGRGSFYPSEYDLYEIGRIADVDSYVRQAFVKKAALMFKEGYDFIGPNRRVIKYINTRLEQIAQASGIPTKHMLRQVGSSLIQKSNAFLIKVRNTKASGGAVRRIPGRTGSIKPVAAYFPVPAENMEYEVNGNKVSKWRQRMPDGTYVEHDPVNVIHFHFDRKDGFVFGTPTLIPVVDDIRALRKIEENIELLIYQHLFPLFQYKVGTDTHPAGVDESGQKEIDIVKTEIQYMPTEGGIVTPERHDIKAIGSEGRALRAEGYLTHFKKRVIAGLGISQVDLGDGDTTNRATSDSMSRNLIDSVKDFQQVLEVMFDYFIVSELLLESTFGPEVLDEENKCCLKFKEIDIEQQIKREAHIVDQFVKHAVTWNEVRMRMGYQPILVPSAEEVENGLDTPDKYPEWNNTYWKLFRLPEVLVQSIDEPWSVAARAASRDNSLPMTGADNKEATAAKKEIDAEAAKAKAPVPSKSNTTKDSFLQSQFIQTQRDIVNTINTSRTFDVDWVSSLIRTELNPTINLLISDQMVSFYRGYSSVFSSDNNYIQAATLARSKFTERANRYVTKLTEDIIRSLKRHTNDIHDTNELVIKTNAVFDALKFRTQFIEDVEIRKAFSLGKAIASKNAGIESLTTQSVSEDACLTCKSNHGKQINLEFVIIDDLPPFHAGCNCTLTQSISTISTQDEIQPSEEQCDPSDYVPEKEFASCPKCGKTALKKKDTPDIYNCRACNHSFRELSDNEQIDDATKKERCILQVKASLRKSHPSWDEEKVKSVAIATCTKQLEK